MKVKSNKLASLQIYKTGELCCTICGTLHNITRFKDGYICSNCLQYVKSQL